MRTILIPVDATAAVENSADFALEWADRYKYNHIILLRSSYESMFNDISTGATYALASKENLNRQQEEATKLLNHLRRRIMKKTSSIMVTTEISKLPLLRRTTGLIKENNSIELVVLGSSHNAVANDSFISANIIRISRVSPVKVLIVPSNCTYKPIQHVLVPCDISSIDTTKRLQRLRTRFERENIRMTILIVNTKENKGNAEQRESRETDIHRYLSGMDYNIHYAFDRDIINGILAFKASHEVDLIAALPGKHSFLYYLVNRSISEGIYRNIDHAVLILK
jgi:hypothetical protein